jgi:periplasmic divalent cation tolerance protein
MSLLLLTTVESPAEGQRIARILVEEKLAACVNIIPGATSIYQWEGKLQESSETLLLIKSRSGLWKRLKARIKSLHAYKLPELVGLRMQKVDRRYAEWLTANTRAIRKTGGRRINEKNVPEKPEAK